MFLEDGDQLFPGDIHVGCKGRVIHALDNAVFGSPVDRRAKPIADLDIIKDIAAAVGTAFQVEEQ